MLLNNLSVPIPLAAAQAWLLLSNNALSELLQNVASTIYELT